MKKGDKATIREIHDADAFEYCKSELIGKSCVLEENPRRCSREAHLKGYVSVAVNMDEVSDKLPNKRVSFYAVKLKRINKTTKS